MSSGAISRLVAFDAAVEVDDGRGGKARSWQEVAQSWAEFRYSRGREAVEAGGLTGSAVFKVKVRANPVTRTLTVQHRLRDPGDGLAYNIREVDAITSRVWVWLAVESGVAV